MICCSWTFFSRRHPALAGVRQISWESRCPRSPFISRTCHSAQMPDHITYCCGGQHGDDPSMVARWSRVVNQEPQVPVTLRPTDTEICLVVASLGAGNKYA